MISTTITDPIYYRKEQSLLKYKSDGHTLCVSSLSSFDFPVESDGFAIKFVSEGVEHYAVNGHNYTIQPMNYLLLNGKKEGKVIIDSKTNVKGICINISPSLILDVVAQIIRPDADHADPDLASFFYGENFLENYYNSKYTQLGRKLELLSASVYRKEMMAEEIHSELFFDLATHLIEDQTTVFRQLQNIPTVKSVTRNDLFRRLSRGKEYMDANFRYSMSIDRIAREASMSEFHFFRLFKKAYGTSPMQYILRARIDWAKILLREGCSVYSVAESSGFGDIFSFSKSFKKHVGISPSEFSRKEMKLQ